MAHYSSERKAALLKKLLPPINLSVAELARQEGVSEQTLYNWRKQAKAEGAVVPEKGKGVRLAVLRFIISHLPAHRTTQGVRLYILQIMPV